MKKKSKSDGVGPLGAKTHTCKKTKQAKKRDKQKPNRACAGVVGVAPKRCADPAGSNHSIRRIAKDSRAPPASCRVVY